MSAMTVVHMARSSGSQHASAVRRLAGARAEQGRLGTLYAAAAGTRDRPFAQQRLSSARAYVASREQWLHWIDEGGSLAPWEDGEWAPGAPIGRPLSQPELHTTTRHDDGAALEAWSNEGGAGAVLGPLPHAGRTVARQSDDTEDLDLRDAMARDRDDRAAERDGAAAARDRMAQAHDAGIVDYDDDCRSSDSRRSPTGEQIVLRAAHERKRGAEERRAAVGQRAAAALDREHAVADRERAAADREHAASGRSAAGDDDLTGALRRGVGLAAVEAGDSIDDLVQRADAALLAVTGEGRRGVTRRSSRAPFSSPSERPPSYANQGERWTRALTRVLAARPDAVAEARRAVRELRLPRTSRESLALVVSELVTNSIRHAGLAPDDSVNLRITHSAGRVRLAVHDRGDGFAVHADECRDLLTPGGVGLVIVDALAETWGVDCDPEGCTVWCEVTAEKDPAGTTERVVTTGYVHELATEMTRTGPPRP